MSVALTGCINLVPVPSFGPAEVVEAKRLTKFLYDRAPEAKQLLLKERDVANQIRITLEITLESPAVPDPNDFVRRLGQNREKLKENYNSLIQIVRQREELWAAISQVPCQTPLAFAVQHSAMRSLHDDIVRTESFIQAAKNVQIRTDLGETKVFPELAILAKQLVGFLSQPVSDPLVSQILELRAEYRIGAEE